MQTTGNLIATTAELTACMQNGKNDFQRRFSGLNLDIDRDTTTIIRNGNGVTGIDGYSNILQYPARASSMELSTIS